MYKYKSQTGVREDGWKHAEAEEKQRFCDVVLQCLSQAFWLEASSSLGWQRVWEFFSTAETLREVQRVGLRHYRKNVLEAPPPATLRTASRTWCCGRSCRTWWCSCRSCRSVWSSNLSPYQSSGWQGGWRRRRRRSWAPSLRSTRTRRRTSGWSGWSKIYLRPGRRETHKHGLGYENATTVTSKCENLSPDLHDTLLFVLFQVTSIIAWITAATKHCIHI